MSRYLGAISIFILIASISMDGSVAQESSFHYYYFKEPIPLVEELGAVAAFDVGNGIGQPLGTLLDLAGYPDSEIRPFPIPGWSIALVSALPGESNPPNAATVISDLRARDTGGRYFYSPVFVTGDGDPLLIDGEIFVRFQEGVSASARQEILRLTGARGVKSEPFGGMENSFKVTINSRSGIEILDVANHLAQFPEVRYAEPNLVQTGRSSFIPNDELFFESWSLHNVGQNPGSVADIDINGPEAWDKTTGKPTIIVVVIDSGVQQDHPDINQIPGNDFTTDILPGDGGPANPCDRHGTIVAGVVSARINNLIGTSGIAPDARIASARTIISGLSCKPSRVFFENEWMVNALQWAEEIGARITNNSYVVALPSSALADKFADTYSKGILHFAGTGNSGDNKVTFPANLPVVNAISAIDWDGARSSFSSFGPEVDFAAPGSGILTTDRTGSDGYVEGDYVVLDGTSLAAPAAAGSAALVLSENPHLTPPEVESLLRETALDLGAPGWDEEYGWGLIRAGNAVSQRLEIFSDGFESGDTSSWSNVE